MRRGQHGSWGVEVPRSKEQLVGGRQTEQHRVDALGIDAARERVGELRAGRPHVVRHEDSGNRSRSSVSGLADREPRERGAGPLDDAGVELIRHGSPHVVRLEDVVEGISCYRNHGLTTLVPVPTGPAKAPRTATTFAWLPCAAMSWLPGHANDSAEMVLGLRPEAAERARELEAALYVDDRIDPNIVATRARSREPSARHRRQRVRNRERTFRHASEPLSRSRSST